MELSDLLAICTTGILRSGDPRWFAILEERADLKKLSRPDTLSIGGRGGNGQPLAYRDWINEWKSSGIRGWKWVYDAQTDLFYLQLTAKQGNRWYCPAPVNSSIHSLTGSKLVELIDAQEKPDALWKSIAAKASERNQRNDQPRISAEKLRAYFTDTDLFRDQTDASLGKDQRISDAFWEVQQECIVMGTPFRVPAGFKNLINRYGKEDAASDAGLAAQLKKAGSDEEELKRLQAQAKLAVCGWSLGVNSRSWETYFFEACSGTAPGGAAKEKGASGLAAAEKEFATALQRSARFAAKIQSSFEGVFSLASWLIRSGSGEMVQWKDWKQVLDKEGFPNPAIQKLKNLFTISEAFQVLDWPVAQHAGLRAWELTDVFHQEGRSWESIRLPPGQDESLFHELTIQLYEARNKYWAALLSEA